MIWAVLQQVGGQAATMLVFFVLAALLSPSDFGLVGMAAAWLGILSAFGETGFGAAIIQRQQVRPEHLSSTFGINLAMGVLLTLVGVLLSWPAALYFRTPGLEPVMAALSLGFVVRAFGLTQAALAQRELRFRALAIRDLAASAAGGGVGIVLAVRGYGVWSLVGMTLVNAMLGTVLLWQLARWRPRVSEMSRSASAELWPYSSNVLGFNLFKAFAQNTDRLIIGPLLGVHALGVYTFASKVAIFPVTVFVGALGAYMFPRVSRIQSDRAGVCEVYRKVLIAILNVVLPGLAVLFVLAPAIVPVLGDRWREATPVIQILAMAALVQAIFGPVGQLMKGLGRPGWLVIWSVGFTALTSLALWIGGHWGLVGTSVGYVLAHFAVLPVILWIGWRLTDFGPLRLLAISWRPLLAATALAAACGIVVRHTGTWGRPALVAGAVFAGAIYVLVLARLNPEFTALVVRELEKLRPGAEEPASVAGPPSLG